MSADWDTVGNTVTQLGTANRTQRVHEWLFLTGNRILIAGGFLLGVVVLFSALALTVSPDEYGTTAFLYLSAAIVGGNFTLITIILSINQLVISQELSAPGELAGEIEASTDYRETVTDLLDQETVPPTPTAFLSVLFDGVTRSLSSLDDHRQTAADSEVTDELGELVSSLGSHVQEANEKLEQSNQTVFSGLVLTLSTNYSEEINEILRLRVDVEDSEGISPEVQDTLDTLVRRLKQIDVTRQYLKTLYLQQELARLSRRLSYVGFPTILAGIMALGMVILTDSVALPPSQLTLVLPLYVTLAVAPLAVLVSFVLRLSVVAERTVAVTPFTTATQEDPSMAEITQD